ncbi:MAG TPA: LysR substrate-binding domain-containing protein [Solirubrobacterales bacterium]|nr:LysR substrate-binding domain-containing protein [Solirubrobacterales bacterium]
MELRHLRYFAALGEELHFRRAAERLRIAQPGLSQQIKRLEEELDVKLLLRTKRRVQLTDAGRAFLVEARRILAEAERAVRIARQTSRGAAGELTIGCTEAGEISVLPRVLPVFRARFPGVRLAVETLNTMAQLKALLDGDIQLGFVRLPCEEDRLLVVEPVLREPLLVVLPEAHALAAYRRIPLGVLAAESWITFPRRLSPGFYDSLVTHCRQAGVTFHVVKEADHFHAQQSLVALGFGVSLQPASMRIIKREGVTYRPLVPPPPYAQMAMAYRRDTASEVLGAFRQVVRRVFPPPGQVDRGSLARRRAPAGRALVTPRPGRDPANRAKER